MVFGRRMYPRMYRGGGYRRRKRSFGRRSMRRYGGGTQGLRRRQLSRTGGFGAGLMELKFVDTQITQGGNGFDTTAAFGSAFNAVGAGNDFTKRLGRRICLEYLDLTYFITIKAGNTNVDKNDMVRVLFYYDLQPNGVAPVIGDVLATTSAVVDASIENINLNNRARFLILYDKMHVVSTGTAPVYRRKRIKLGGLETTFNSANPGATIADISTGAVGAFCPSANFSTASGFFPVVSMHVRIRFRDCS